MSDILRKRAAMQTKNGSGEVNKYGLSEAQHSNQERLDAILAAARSEATVIQSPSSSTRASGDTTFHSAHSNRGYFEVSTERGGRKVMSEEEVSSLVHNALRRARQATSSVSPRHRVRTSALSPRMNGDASTATSPRSPNPSSGVGILLPKEAELGSQARLPKPRFAPKYQSTGGSADDGSDSDVYPNPSLDNNLSNISVDGSQTNAMSIGVPSTSSNEESSTSDLPMVASVNSSEAIIRRVEEEIANARKAAQEANRRLAGVSANYRLSPWSQPMEQTPSSQSVVQNHSASDNFRSSPWFRSREPTPTNQSASVQDLVLPGLPSRDHELPNGPSNEETFTHLHAKTSSENPILRPVASVGSDGPLNLNTDSLLEDTDNDVAETTVMTRSRSIAPFIDDYDDDDKVDDYNYDDNNDYENVDAEVDKAEDEKYHQESDSIANQESVDTAHTEKEATAMDLLNEVLANSSSDPGASTDTEKQDSLGLAPSTSSTNCTSIGQKESEESEGVQMLVLDSESMDKERYTPSTEYDQMETTADTKEEQESEVSRYFAEIEDASRALTHETPSEMLHGFCKGEAKECQVAEYSHASSTAILEKKGSKNPDLSQESSETFFSQFSARGNIIMRLLAQNVEEKQLPPEPVYVEAMYNEVSDAEGDSREVIDLTAVDSEGTPFAITPKSEVHNDEGDIHQTFSDKSSSDSSLQAPQEYNAPEMETTPHSERKRSFDGINEQGMAVSFEIDRVDSDDSKLDSNFRSSSFRSYGTSEVSTSIYMDTVQSDEMIAEPCDGDATNVVPVIHEGGSYAEVEIVQPESIETEHAIEEEPMAAPENTLNETELPSTEMDKIVEPPSTNTEEVINAQSDSSPVDDPLVASKDEVQTDRAWTTSEEFEKAWESPEPEESDGTDQIPSPKVGGDDEQQQIGNDSMTPETDGDAVAAIPLVVPQFEITPDNDKDFVDNVIDDEISGNDHAIAEAATDLIANSNPNKKTVSSNEHDFTGKDEEETRNVEVSAERHETWSSPTASSPEDENKQWRASSDDENELQNRKTEEEALGPVGKEANDSSETYVQDFVQAGASVSKENDHDSGFDDQQQSETTSTELLSKSSKTPEPVEASKPPLQENMKNNGQRSNKVQFKQRYPVPPLVSKPRPSEEIAKDHRISQTMSVPFLSKPKPDLQQLLQAVVGSSLHRRSNACGALKVLSTQKKNQLTLVRTAGFLDALVFAATAKIPREQREAAMDARLRAVITISNVCERKDNREIVFNHPNLAIALVRTAKEAKLEGRASACGALAMLAKTPSNREPMSKTNNLISVLATILCDGKFDEENVRVPTSNAPIEDENSIRQSFSTDSRSTNSSESSISEEEEEAGVPAPTSMREQKQATTEGIINRGKLNACAALLHMSKQCGATAHMCYNAELMDALIEVAHRKEDPMHTKCLEIVCNLTRFPGNVERLSTYPGLIDSLVLNGGPTRNPEDRVWSLRAMQNLSTHHAGKTALANRVVLELLSFSIMRETLEEQFAATATLYNLSTEPGAVVQLTNTKNVVATLVHVAHNPETPSDVRLMACDALATLGLWLQTLAGAGKVPKELGDDVTLPTYVTNGWNRWD